MSQAGRLVPSGSAYEIHVNAGDSVGRQRFSIAHEIAHTFFSMSRGVNDAVVGTFADPETSEEFLCDLAAARMLFHPRWLTPLVESEEPGLDRLLEIRDACAASIEATANAVARSSGWPCWSLVVWEPGLRKEERRRLGQLGLGNLATPPEQKMRVKRTYAGAGSPFMPPNKSASPGTSIDTAWRSESRIAAEEVLGTGSGNWLVRSEAMFAPYALASGQLMPRVVSSVRWLRVVRATEAIRR